MPLVDWARKEIEETCDVYAERKILTTPIMVAGISGEKEVPKAAIVVEDMKSIEKTLESFNATCWPAILATNLKATKSGYRFRTKEIELHSLCTAGRILITVRYRKNKKDECDWYLSVVGAEEENCTSCGLQGLYITKEKAIELLARVVQQWDPKKYRPYEKVHLW